MKKKRKQAEYILKGFDELRKLAGSLWMLFKQFDVVKVEKS
jgi:hypothetical protein